MEKIVRIQRRNGVCVLTAASGRQWRYPLVLEEHYPLREGDEADMEEVDRRVRAHARPCALGRIAQMQAARDHTQRELLEALLRLGYPEDCARDAVGEMCSAGFAGDGRYCESLIRRKGKKEGRAKLAWKMRAQGVDDETVRQALEAHLSQEEEEEAACAQAEKLRRRGTEEKKIFLHLARKGYSREVCLKALRRTGEEERT